ncbi:MAG TPA: TrbG/VirB9 family P-type conjugative transfer protein [Thermoanaerobaculia bacterium]|nr:TrbG/VirB9 family P-type conjugative transfer protein [Thermoanaerobaculia bacterium]
MNWSAMVVALCLGAEGLANGAGGGMAAAELTAAGGTAAAEEETAAPEQPAGQQEAPPYQAARPQAAAPELRAAPESAAATRDGAAAVPEGAAGREPVAARAMAVKREQPVAAQEPAAAAKNGDAAARGEAPRAEAPAGETAPRKGQAEGRRPDEAVAERRGRANGAVIRASAGSAVIGASGASGASAGSAGSGAIETAPGDLLVPFGHGRATVRCAPLRACAIELEAGEVVLSTSSGDSERWLIQAASAGRDGRTPLLVVKPTGCDLATNLLISTDRRLYEVELDSPPCRDADVADGDERADSGHGSDLAHDAHGAHGSDTAGGGGEGRQRRQGAYNPRLSYTGVLRFSYPDELVRRWAREEELAALRAARAARAQREAASQTPLAPRARLTSLNFDYAWERGRGFPWTPAQVFDDGEHTYVVLPEGARYEAAPVLFAEQPDGTLALLNYHLENRTYVTDRVLAKGVLVIGSEGGRRKNEQRLEITNRRRTRS